MAEKTSTREEALNALVTEKVAKGLPRAQAIEVANRQLDEDEAAEAAKSKKKNP